MASKQTNGQREVLPILPFTSCLDGAARFSARGATNRILIADGSASNASKLASSLDDLGYEFVEAKTTSEALSSLAVCHVEAIFISQEVAEIGGVALCRTLKNASATRFLPVFITSSKEDPDDAVAAFEAGADGYLVAPWNPRVIRAQVQSSLRRKAVVDSLDDPETVLFSLAQSIEERDGSLGEHCERLAVMSVAIGVRLGLSPEDIVTLQRAAYLHDIGKLAIPDNILFKAGPLTEHEWEIMKSHTERGERICGNMRSLTNVLPVVRHHHEKWDGTGYPDQLRGEEIPLLARVLQTADIYDALTTGRPYKRAFTPEEAYAIIKSETDKGWRDPAMTEVLRDLLPMFKDTILPDLSRSSLHALANSIDSFRKDARSLTCQPRPANITGAI